MAEPETQRDELEALAADFLDRQRRGDRPSTAEYAAAHPELAEEIQDLFPTIAAVERLKVEKQQSHAGRPAPGGVHLERLGEFRIVREIGRGGMGIVYEAEQESLGRRVAIKVLPRHFLLAPEQLQRFQREARIAAQLRHAHIVTVFGVGEHEGFHYYVMQLIPGLGLDKIIARLASAAPRTGPLADTQTQQAAATGGRKPPAIDDVATTLFPGLQRPAGAAASQEQFRADARYWQSVARIGFQAAVALHYAHTQGTLHCDVKPANLLIDGQGGVWITDFGVAKAMQFEKLTQTGDVTGTLQYTAPERFQGETDARSDVYSLGLTLYELLTLQPAFGGSDRQQALRRILDGTPPPPRQLEPQVPRDLETIVLKAMARDPQRRYASAAELAEDLERYLEGRPIRARRVSCGERCWRWCRRNPAMVALATAVAVLTMLVALLAVVGLRAGSSPPPAERPAADSAPAGSVSERPAAEMEPPEGFRPEPFGRPPKPPRNWEVPPDDFGPGPKLPPRAYAPRPRGEEGPPPKPPRDREGLRDMRGPVPGPPEEPRRPARKTGRRPDNPLDADP